MRCRKRTSFARVRTLGIQQSANIHYNRRVVVTGTDHRLSDWNVTLVLPNSLPSSLGSTQFIHALPFRVLAATEAFDLARHAQIFQHLSDPVDADPRTGAAQIGDAKR